MIFKSLPIALVALAPLMAAATRSPATDPVAPEAEAEAEADADAEAEAEAAAAGIAASRSDRALARIRSRADLDDYLALSHPTSNPLAALSPPAMERFVASLRFGPAGLVSFDGRDIEAELSVASACRLLALFGLQAAVGAMPALEAAPLPESTVFGRRKTTCQPYLRFAVPGAAP